MDEIETKSGSLPVSTTVYQHIEVDGDVAYVSGTRTKVVEIALDRIAHHWDAEEIRRQHPHLSLGQIHAALAYYFDHRDELDDVIRRQLEHVDEVRRSVGESAIRAKLDRDV